MRRHEFELIVPTDAIDPKDHVNNVEYVRWVQDAASRHARQLGFSKETYRRNGEAFVVRRHEVDYLKPASEGDKLLVASWLVSTTRISAVWGTEIRDSTGELILTARTTWVWVELQTMRPKRIPPVVRSLFGADDGGGPASGPGGFERASATE